MATPTLALIPTGYKAGKLYSVLPESGVGDFTVVRATEATRVNEDGLIETMGANVPRLDYSAGGCPVLLTEPQRTNLIAYSEDFSQSYWAKTNTTVISNVSVSPDGTQNADKLNFTTSNGEIVKGMAFVSGQKYTMSFYAKTESGTLDFAYGNMDYGIISGTATTEWQRFEITQTLPTTTRFPKIQTTEIGSLLLWGFQIEQGSYPTSLINTSGSAVTRNADQVYGAGDAATFNDSEGVLMIETKVLEDGRMGISNSDNSDQVLFGNSGGIFYRIIENNANPITKYIQVSQFENHKIALKYKSTETSIFVDGFELDTNSTSYSLSGLNELAFVAQGSSFYGNTSQVQYFDTALTDLELEKITSWASFSDMANALNYTIQ